MTWLRHRVTAQTEAGLDEPVALAAIHFSLTVNFDAIAKVKERLVRHEGRRTSRRLDSVAKIMVGTAYKVQDRGIPGEMIDPLFSQSYAITLGD